MENVRKQMLRRMEEERTEALKSLDKDRIVAFLARYDEPGAPENDAIFWAGVHQARLRIPELTEAEKEVSRDWLRQNGFNEGICL